MGIHLKSLNGLDWEEGGAMRVLEMGRARDRKELARYGPQPI